MCFTVSETSFLPSEAFCLIGRVSLGSYNFLRSTLGSTECFTIIDALT